MLCLGNTQTRRRVVVHELILKYKVIFRLTGSYNSSIKKISFEEMDNYLSVIILYYYIVTLIDLGLK